MLIDIYESFRKEVRANAEALAEDPGETAALAAPPGTDDPVVEAVVAAEAERWSDPAAG